MLAAARREIGRRAGAGRDDRSLEVEALAAALEADPADRATLARAEAARRRAERFEAGPPSGSRALRERRAAEVHRAAGELLLAGELVADGAGRVRLPGFGGSTWRAIGILRAGAGGPERRLAETVAAEPASDLGAAAPTFMAGLRADPGLVAAARRIHLLEAVRQDARNALLAAEAALAAALEAGHEDSAGIVRADCAALASGIAELDAAIERAWRAGLRQAEATRDRPPPEGWEDLVPGPAEVVLEHWRRMYVEGDLDAVDELVAEDYVNHEAAEDRAPGRRGARETVAWLREAFADLTMDVDDVIEQGDKVVVRATMRGRHVGAAGPLARFPVTGREFAVQHIHIFRVADGRIAEHWACRDDLGHLAQLGLLPGA